MPNNTWTMSSFMPTTWVSATSLTASQLDEVLSDLSTSGYVACGGRTKKHKKIKNKAKGKRIDYVF